MTVRVLKLNSEGASDTEPMDFPTVEKAMAWCEADRGAKLEWGEEGRFFALEGMTWQEREAMGEYGDYPAVRYWIAGFDENLEPRELEDSDFEDPNNEGLLSAN